MEYIVYQIEQIERLMDRLTAMRVFTEIADRGSITSAGDALDMSRAMVSRYLESLEQWLGVRVLHRTTRRVSLTEAGAEALERCRQMLALEADVQTVAGLRQQTPSGKLRVTTSTSFAQACLSQMLAEFVELYPKTQIELLMLERAVNLVEARVDLAVRISNQLDDTLLARSLGQCRSVLCAAPSYLARRGTPRHPEELTGHSCVTHTYVGRTELRLQRGGQQLRIPVTGALQSDETVVTRQVTLAGAGIAMLPTYLVHQDLRAGTLVHVLPDCEPEIYGIHALYLSRQYQPQLLRALLDFLVGKFETGVPWEETTAQAMTKSRSRKRT